MSGFVLLSSSTDNSLLSTSIGLDLVFFSLCLQGRIRCPCVISDGGGGGGHGCKLCMKVKVSTFLVVHKCLSPGKHWGHSCPTQCPGTPVSEALMRPDFFMPLSDFFSFSLMIDICLFWALFACTALVGSLKHCSIFISVRLRVTKITHAYWFMP